MALFVYRAVDKDGKSFDGEIKASDRREAASALSRQGLLPIRLRSREEERQARGRIRSSLSWSVPLFSSITTVDKILLARHLSVILKTGTSLHEALEILHDDFKKPFVRKLIAEARSHIEEGEPLSNFFARYPQYFQPVFVGLIRAGEVSGTLDTAFLSLYNQLFRDYDLLRRVRMAMIYPLILLIGSVGIIILMMTFILPRMAAAFRGVVSDLPLVTRFFIGVSNYLGAYPAFTVFVFIAIVAGGFFFSRSRRGKKLFLRLFERLPISSELIKKLALARFTRTLRNLLVSGVSAIDGIDIAATTVANPTYADSLRNITRELRRGSSLSGAFRAHPELYPSFFSSIMAIGEKTGTLEQSLDTLSSFYEEEVDRLLRSLVSLIEPLLIFIMGIVVALIALSVLLPIFRIVRTFQR